MTDKKHVFVSYSTLDAIFVGRLREDLERHKIAYWIDKEGLRPGTPNWEKGIRKAIEESFAVIYVVTPNSYASKFVQGEIAIAQMENCPVYPVWVDGEWHKCVPIDIVKTQNIDLRVDRYELNREELFTALRGERPELAVPPLKPVILAQGEAPRNPYKGLNAFTGKDVGDFFGRDELVNQLLDAVKGRVEDSTDHLLTVIGASGSGKSSVVMAGLLPKLKSGVLHGSDQWTYLKPMVPGDHPVQALTRVLLDTPELNVPIDTIQSDLQHPSGMGLHRLALRISKQPVVLYIDQFEELFMTGVPEDERQQLVSLLTFAVTQPDSPVLVLMSLRADFYDRPMNDPILGRLVQAYNRSVLPMSIADLRDTVEKPAAAAGLSFEVGLVADIIFDLRDDKNAQAGALPLLQYTLEQLYERRSDRNLTTTTYKEIGGVKGAIGAHAEKIFQTLDAEAQSSFGRVFQALVHVDDRGTPTRKRETEALLTSQPSTDRLVQALIRHARVLRVYTEKLGDTPYIEVAHEALLTSWQRLAIWIKDVENDLRTIQEMKAAAARWASEGRPKSRLWSYELQRPAYQALKNLNKSIQEDLTTDEQAFLQPEAERLENIFIAAPYHEQLTLIHNNFAPIGVEAVPVLVRVYGYRKLSRYADDEIGDATLAIHWKYPIQTVEGISTELMNKDIKVRKGIVELIGMLRLFSLVYYVQNALEDRDDDIRKAAIGALKDIGDSANVGVLVEALKDSNEDVRSVAARALGEIKDASNVGVKVYPKVKMLSAN